MKSNITIYSIKKFSYENKSGKAFSVSVHILHIILIAVLSNITDHDFPLL
jgi:hypothetical protein